MTFGKVCGVLVFLSLAATGAAVGRDISHGTAGIKATPASKAGMAAISAKANKSAAKTAATPVAARHVKPPAPIVMGRSVSVHHNTKLHHVKIKPLDSSDTPVASTGAY